MLNRSKHAASSYLCNFVISPLSTLQPQRAVHHAMAWPCSPVSASSWSTPYGWTLVWPWWTCWTPPTRPAPTTASLCVLLMPALLGQNTITRWARTWPHVCKRKWFKHWSDCFRCAETWLHVPQEVPVRCLKRLSKPLEIDSQTVNKEWKSWNYRSQ